MKKSLIALAVAGAFAAPAFAATSNVDVYGVMNIAVQGISDPRLATTNDDVTILDNTSRIGFKGSEDLGGGLKAIWQIESALGGNGTTAIGGADMAANRNTFVGLAGGFGTVLMGRHDTPYKLGTVSLDIFGDTIGDYNLGRTDGVELLMNAHDHRNGQALAYISPTWSGFHFAVAGVISNGEAGSALINQSDDTLDAVSATAVYANGPLFASLSYQKAEDAASATGLQDSKGWKLGVGYTFGDAKVGFVYEDISGAAGERDSWLINGAYAMGPMVLKAQYGQVDAGAADQSAWAIGLDYNLSKRTSAYFVYASGDDDTQVTTAGTTFNPDGQSGWNIGVKHSF